jgi:ribosomal protein L37AE/L43A
MPWHLSRSDPRKVYDERHNTVCVCQNADQANLILRAVLAYGVREVVELREPQPMKPIQPAETFFHDDCCSARLQKADRTKITEWTCPKCGARWTVAPSGPLLHWSPANDFFVLPTGRE